MIGILARFFAGLPIRNKMMLLFMLLSAAVLVLAGAIFVLSGAQSFQRDQRQNLTSLAAVIAENSAATLAFDDQQAARQLLRGLASHQDIVAAYLVGHKGDLFASYERPGVKLEAGMDIGATHAATVNLAIVQRYADEVAQPVSWCAPVGMHKVLLEGQDLGTVLLISSNEPFMKGLFNKGLLAVAVFLLSAVVAYLLAARLQRVITAPILQLTTVMHQVSTTKDYSIRADLGGRDEIGKLYSGFNEMLCEIEERNQLLSERQEHLQKLAHLDVLTGLPNRSLFFDRLGQALRHAERDHHNVMVVFIDLDHFKDVNDSLGHRIGDLLIVEVARRLKDKVRASDTVARLGGDEFTLFAQDVGSSADVQLVAEHLVNLFRQPFTFDGRDLYVTASIGITLFPQDGTTVDELLRNADLAMYLAKERGKNAFELFTPELNSLVTHRLALLNDLHHALERQEFLLVYQPRVALASGRMTGMEALIRWQHPVQGIVMPGTFIAMAEENGLIVGITDWVIHEVCRQQAAWLKEGYPVVPVAVNLAATLFKRQVVVPLIVDALAASGLDPVFLEVEITEGALLLSEEALGQLQALKELGIIIAIDDFGTGYSSLSYLQRFPIDILKIDKSFVWSIPSESNDLAIITAIIAMARSLGLAVVAEGVEKPEQLAFLHTMGCKEIQGYLASRPVAADQVPRFFGDYKFL
jgi:diguanylate cyclase